MEVKRIPLLACLLAAALGLLALPAQARCIDEGRLEGVGAAPDEPSPQPIDPRATLQGLVRDALDRSNAVGASRLLSEASLSDIDEVRAGRLPQASLSAGAGPGGTVESGARDVALAQLRASLNVSQLLYDGGRTDRLTDWRTQLAESARLGYLTVREQLAMNTVALALERSRFRQHVVIYGQYVRKMECLVEALDSIVRADRGRASELVQAQKTLQQAQLLQVGAQSQARQIDARLRRLVGDGLPGVQGLSTVLLDVGPLAELVAEVEMSSEIGAITAQAAAANAYARVVESGGKPQVSWAFTGGGVAAVGRNPDSPGSGRAANFSLGLAVNIPLYTPGLAPASDAARRRAEAARLQRAEALEARRYRVVEVHEQTLASFDRARRVGAVLRESEQLRNFTLQQWQQLGRRSLFDVMGAEAEHYNLRVAYINALHDGQQMNAMLLSLGRGVQEWLR